MEKQVEKPFYKKKWFIIVAIIFGIGLISSAFDNTPSTPIQPETGNEKVITENKDTTPVPVEENKKTDTTTPTNIKNEVNTTTTKTTTPTQTDRASILVILKERASSKWGTDYKMVQYEYNNQVEAYDWVVSQTKYPEIVTKAKSKWGNDYQMVKYEYNNQVEAYEWITAQTAYLDIMSKAKQKWGTDYTMVKYEYNNQVEAYKNI